MSNYVQNKSEDALNEFRNEVSLMTSNQYNTTPGDIVDKIGKNMKGDEVHFKKEMEHVFANNVQKYLSETYNSILYNDVNNTNVFVMQNVRGENQRSDQLRKQLTNELHKSRQQYMESNYYISFYRSLQQLFQKSLIFFMMISILLVFFVDNMITFATSMMVIGILLAVYLMIVIQYFVNKSKRRRDDWHKFEFNVNIKKNRK